ncbi:V-type ATPase subunit [Candidatus Woesearchaeota archaeon]|nr:V-type ATPase subunit [Candidatus Woesearchaeota archaeon]
MYYLATKMMEEIMQALGGGPILILTFVFLLIISVMTYLILHIRPVMPYLYLSAIIQSRSKSMLNQGKMKQISEAKSTKDMLSMLSDTLYADESCENVTLSKMHKHFEEAFQMHLKEVYDLSPVQMRKLLDMYMIFQEASIIKMLYKVKKFKKPLDKDLVYPVGMITDKLLHKLINVDSIEEFCGYLFNTPYHKVLIKSHEVMEEFDTAVDNITIETIIKNLETLKIQDKQLVYEILDTIVDIKNINMSLQSLTRGNILPLITKRGSLDSNKLSTFKNIDELVTYLEKTKYKENVKSAAESYKNDKSVMHYDIELNRYLKSFIGKNRMLNPQGAFNVFSYIISLEIEKRNLFTLSKGVASGFSSQEIMGMVI